MSSYKCLIKVARCHRSPEGAAAVTSGRDSASDPSQGGGRSLRRSLLGSGGLLLRHCLLRSSLRGQGGLSLLSSRSGLFTPVRSRGSLGLRCRTVCHRLRLGRGRGISNLKQWAELEI